MDQHFAPKPTPNGLRRELGLQPDRLATVLNLIGKTGVVLVLLSSPVVFLWASSHYSDAGSRSLGAGVAWMLGYLIMGLVPCFLLVGNGTMMQANRDLAGSVEHLTQMYESLHRLAIGDHDEAAVIATETLRDQGLLSAEEVAEVERRARGIRAKGTNEPG